MCQFRRKDWIGLDNLSDRVKQLARDALKSAMKTVKEKKPHLLILDEVNLALHCRLIKLDEISQLLDKTPKSMDVVLTEYMLQKNS